MRTLRRLIAVSVLALPLAMTTSTAPSATAHKTQPADDPDVIVEWNEIAFRTLNIDATTPPPPARPRKPAIEGYLYLGFMHAAIYNAVVGIEGGYKPYRFHAQAPHKASSQAAAVAAAYQVLLEYSPEQADALTADYDASLAEIPDGKPKTRGVAYGERAAASVIAQRVDDGRSNPDNIQWTRPPAPGIWQPTPPALAPFLDPWLGFMDPLLIKDGAQFDPGPPPALTSPRYTRDFDEVKADGSLTSTTRTPEQTAIATFYSGNPIRQFTLALQDQASKRHLDIAESARMFAAVHMSLADAAISIFYSKYVYGVWRPITAIQLADTDDNPATTADPLWNSLIPSPPYPDYVSGYNGVMGAFTRALQEVLDTPRLRLDLTSTAAPGVTLSYKNGRQARKDVIDARVWLGIHFRFADTAGARMGQQVARYALHHYFKPVRRCQHHCH